ncbi:hypothetical protein HZB60_03380 [candidate division KSB1 bacterium]|nr:hypothetical protein [candidate division KSB1 bacterium]
MIDGETRKALIKAHKKSAELIKPFVVGDDVRKYHIREFDRYVIAIRKGWTLEHAPQGADPTKWFRETYPALWEHLLPHKTKAIARQDQGDFWWELRACDYYDAFEQPKIVYPEIAMESRFAFDDEQLYSNKTTFIIPRKDPYLLGLLNSKLMWLFLMRLCSVLGDADKRGRLLQQRIYIEQLPIRTIDLKDKADKSRHDRMVKLVETMLELNRRLPETKSPVEQEKLARRIAATDREIDVLVYELYGLSEAEIRLVEGQN